MTEHSILGASSAHRWMLCPGSVALCATQPSQTSPYAEEGTAAHGVAEHMLHCFKSGLSEDLRSVASSPWPEAFPKWKQYFLNDDMEDHRTAIQLYIDQVAMAYAEVENDGGILDLEKSFKLDWLRPGMWGTADAVVTIPFEKLIVFDLKYGMGKGVEVENNPQGMYYALGALGEDNEHMVNEVEIVIVQPRFPHPGGPVRSWTISVDDLYKWGKEVLLPHANAADPKLSPNAPLSPGDIQCQFCDAVAVCPAVVSRAIEVAQADFSNVEITLASPSDMSTMDISRALDFADVLSKWVNEIRAYAHRIANTGTVIPSRKLIAKSGRRKWRNEQEVIDSLSMLYSDEDIFDPPKLKSPAQMEKTVGYEVIKDLFEKPDLGNALVHVSHKSPAVSPSVEADFGGEDDLFGDSDLFGGVETTSEEDLFGGEPVPDIDFLG